MLCLIMSNDGYTIASWWLALVSTCSDAVKSWNSVGDCINLKTKNRNAEKMGEAGSNWNGFLLEKK